MISTLSGLTYKNIGKTTNKMFKIPNHLRLCHEKSPEKNRSKIRH